MGNPSSEHRSPEHRNTHNEDSRPAIVVRWWCYLRKLLMAVHPHSGTALPHPAPPSFLHTPVRLYSPPDAPPSTKWPPTSISTADGSCWNLCAIWVSATPPFPRPLWGTPLLIWLEIKKHLNGISLASPAAAKIRMINVLVFVILFIVQISPKKKKLFKFYRMYKTHFL